MKKGKVSDTILGRSVYKLLGKRGTNKVSRPAYGQDAAHIDCNGENVLVTAASGLWPVYRAANNISAAGGRIVTITDTVLIDEKSREIRLKEIISELDRQCMNVNIPVASGHTAVSPDVVKPVVSVTGIGLTTRTASKAKPGQDIVMTKCIGISGIRYIADKKKGEILKVFSEDVVNKAVGNELDMLIYPEADIFMQQGTAGAMHDVSEGGIFAALWDMAEYSGVGLDIDFRAIPVRQEIIEICELLNINPYILDSMGCLLMTCENGCDIVNVMQENGIRAAVIGKVTAGNDRIIHNVEEDRYLGLPEQDEIYRFID